MGEIKKDYSLFDYMYKQAQIDALLIKSGEIQHEIGEYEASNIESTDEETQANMLEIAELKDQLRINGDNIKRLKASCDHELVLYLGKEHINGEDQGLAICLECEQKLYLKTIDKDLEIDPDAIIDIVGIIPEDYICTYDGIRNILVTRAKEKLFYLSETHPTMELWELKQNIVEDLVYYTDDLTYRKINPRKRKRVLSNKNK